jgi:hypothetical protein
LQLPSSLRIEPMKLCTGAVVDMAAGDTIPDTDVVVLSGAGQKLSRALLGGQKQQLKVLQQLYYLGPQAPAGAGAGAGAGTAWEGEATAALEGGEGTAAAAGALAAMAEAQPAAAAAGGRGGQRPLLQPAMAGCSSHGSPWPVAAAMAAHGCCNACAIDERCA